MQFYSAASDFAMAATALRLVGECRMLVKVSSRVKASRNRAVPTEIEQQTAPDQPHSTLHLGEGGGLVSLEI